jgi:N-acetylmuramoyl-L-alanine amidase/putative methionine-R-sulfoxide reductase with GAF domain
LTAQVCELGKQMSATPNNAAPGWDNARPLQPAAARETRVADGHNALQGLLAFACVHQQAARRKREAQGPVDSPLKFSREEELALDEILQLVAARAVAITGADGVAIALAKERAIVCRASAGKIAPDAGVRLDPNSGFSGACLRSGEIVRCDDSENDARVNPQACRALGARSMIAVPLSAKKRVIGLLEAFSAETFGFNDSDVRSLNLLGELILAAIRPEEEHHLTEMAREVIPDAAVSSKPKTDVPLVAQPSLQANRELSSAASDAAADGEEAAVVLPARSQKTPAPVPVPEASEKPTGEEIPTSVAPPTAIAPASANASKLPVEEKLTPSAPDACTSLPETAVEPSSAGKKIEIGMPTPTPRTETVGNGTAAAAPALPLALTTAVAPEVKLDAEEVKPAVPSETPAEERRSMLSLAVTVAAAMIAIGMMGVLIWKAQHLGQPISASTGNAAQARAEETLRGAAPAVPAPPLKIGQTAQVTGIHHSSTADTSTVVIDLEDQVQYEAHTLDNPPRVYFDLHDTTLSPTVGKQAIAVDDAFLKRVRVAQPVEGITRVVLETKGQPDASVPEVRLDTNPYRLTIEFHRATAPPVASPAPSTLPKPSPAIKVSPNQPRASSEVGLDNGGFRVVLDAGHGGWDLGAVGRKGLLEKELVFDVVERLGSLLEKRLGATVVYTRQEDSFISLEKRAEIANLARADLFLSIHANYSNLSTARGVETYYTNTYSSMRARTPEAASLQQVDWSGVVDIRAKVKGAKLFASAIQRSLYGGLAARNPGVRNRGVKEAEYVVLTGTQMPAVLAEISYVSSPADEDRLQSSEYRQVIAEALYKGIASYRGETQRKIARLQKISQ